MKTNEECAALFNTAYSAGFDAGKAVIPPEYTIVECDPFTGQPKPNAKRYPMTGTCGFAWVNVKPANSRFAKWLVLANMGRKDSYAGGVRFSVQEFGQCLEQKEAFARAFSNVLSNAGIKSYADSRID